MNNILQLPNLLRWLGNPIWMLVFVSALSAQAPRLVRTLEGHTGEVSSIAFGPGGKTLASASWTHTKEVQDTVIRLWDANEGKSLPVLGDHKIGVLSIAYSPDGRFLASSSGLGVLKLWDVANRTNTIDFIGSKGMIHSIAFSPDGKTLASAGGARQPDRLWDVSTAKNIAS